MFPVGGNCLFCWLITWSFSDLFLNLQTVSKMTIKAKIWDYKPKDSGECDIKIYASHGGSHRYFSTGLSVTPQDWDVKKGAVKKHHPFAIQYNGIIRRKSLEIEETLLSGALMRDIGKKVASKGLLLDFVQTYRREIADGLHQITPGTDRNYQSLVTRLNQYCGSLKKPDIAFDDIDQDFYNDFWRFLSAKYQVGKPGFSKHVKNIKKFMREAQERGLHKNEAYRGRNFRVYKEVEGVKIFLTELELQNIVELDLSKNKPLEVERDRFMVNYFFLLRFGDGLRISPEGFIKAEGTEFFSYRSQKTGTAVTIPVKPAAMEILDRYGRRFPRTTNQEANRKLKLIASMAGIDNLVNAGNPKWMHVTTHTARRSAATNLYLHGVSLKMIAQLGGWTDLETLKFYLLASGIDVAKVAAELDFFK